jgi:epoxyqueuosine reductase QueG
VDHPILREIAREGFVPLGWFAARDEDRVPDRARFVILIGNAGPAMFRRFAQEREGPSDLLDEWSARVVNTLAQRLEAKAVFPFDTPPLPFLTWARRGGAGHVSPLGLNIHPTYGLWHAYRAALLFPVEFDLPSPVAAPSPCATCAGRPCLSACPVSAFSVSGYDVDRCVNHVASAAGKQCMTDGCLARHACPVGKAFAYHPEQAAFHMKAFLKSRLAARQQSV